MDKFDVYSYTTTKRYVSKQYPNISITLSKFDDYAMVKIVRPVIIDTFMHLKCNYRVQLTDELDRLLSMAVAESKRL